MNFTVPYYPTPLLYSVFYALATALCLYLLHYTYIYVQKIHVTTIRLVLLTDEFKFWENEVGSISLSNSKYIISFLFAGWKGIFTW